MSEETRRRKLLEDVEAALSEQAGAQAYQRSPRLRTRKADRPRPLEFDANGFPVPQRSRSSAARGAGD
jgi:hypothetical protein